MSEEIVRALTNNEEFINRVATEVYEKVKKEILLTELGEFSWCSTEERWPLLDSQEKVLQEMNKKLDRHEMLLEKHGKILEEHGKSLEEIKKSLERHEKLLEQHGKMLESHGKMLEDHGVRLTRIENTLREDLEKIKLNLARYTSRAGKAVMIQKGLRINGINPDKVQYGEIEDPGRAESTKSISTRLKPTKVKSLCDEAVVDQLFVRRKILKKQVKVFAICNDVYKSVKEKLEKDNVIAENVILVCSGLR